MNEFYKRENIQYPDDLPQRDRGDETTHDPERDFVLRQAANLDPVLKKMQSDPDRIAAGWANAALAYKLGAVAEAQQAGTTDKLLDTRAKTHGDYSVHARVTQGIERIIYENFAHPELLTDTMRETIHMIAHKMGRIAAGDPDFGDHWRDTAGYAKLQADRCTKG